MNKMQQNGRWNHQKGERPNHSLCCCAQSSPQVKELWMVAAELPTGQGTPQPDKSECWIDLLDEQLNLNKYKLKAKGNENKARL